MEEYFVHVSRDDKEQLESYLGGRDISYKIFELRNKAIFQTGLEKEALDKLSELEYVALVEPVNPVKMCSVNK